MIKRLLLIVAIFIHSQISLSQVNLQLGAGVGLTSPLADYKGTTIEYYQGKNYGLTSGYNFYGKVRAGIFGTNIIGEIGFISLSNSGNSEPDKGKIELKQNLIALKVGPEFQFTLPTLPIKPYIGGNIIYTIFTGETSFNGVAEVPSGNHKMKTTSRLGLGGNGGVLIKLNPILSLDISAYYHFINLIGKSWDAPITDKVKRINSYMYLNDDKDPLGYLNSTEHFISKSRTIQTAGLSIGLMFGL